MIKGFIFDLDGVITDTIEFHFQAWKRLADEEGLPFTREDYGQLRGVSRRGSLDLVLKGEPIDEATAQAWMARKNSYYLEFLQDLSPNDTLPGAREFLQSARRAGMKIGLESSSRNAGLVITGLQMLDWFDAIGEGNMIANPKPAPDLYVWVAGRLGLPATQCVVFEDAAVGHAGARVANMYCVAVNSVDYAGDADLCCEGLDDITVEEVLALADD